MPAALGRDEREESRDPPGDLARLRHFEELMTRIIITGAKGRMGQALIACAAKIPDLEVAAKIDLGDDLSSVIQKTEVVVDFSFHTATVSIAELCVRHKKALVIGTTGHLAAEQSAIRKLQSVIPIVWASNYSTGVNALFWLAR